MQLHRLVETFDEKARRCHNFKELSELISLTVPDLGFQKFSLIQWLWFRAPKSSLICIDNYGDYGEKFVAREDYLYDPVRLACQRTSRAFVWGDIPSMISLKQRQHHILERAGQYGLRSGLTLPIATVGEPSGACSFATSSGDLPSRWHCRAAVLIGSSAFHEARRLCGYPARAIDPPIISLRKQEILQFAAIGKTDPEIAMILGLSKNTIETYIRQLLRSLDVYNRTQLCVKALRLGLIAFDDVYHNYK